MALLKDIENNCMGHKELMIERIPFGRTGHESARAIFGAAALGEASQDEADRTLELLLNHNINHIDTAASYGDSEERIGPWMREHRSDFFLATKTGERTYAKAREEIHRSLDRLRVEQIDLIQLHCLIGEDEWQVAMNSGGALEAAIEAREEGLVRFIGVTGHGLDVARMHVRSLERFSFDSVLLPFSWMMMQNEAYAHDFWALRAVCEEKGVALQTIKSISRRPWGVADRNRTTWYEPLEDPEAIAASVGWVLSHQNVFLNTVGDTHVLPRALEAIAQFDPQSQPADFENTMQRLMSEREMAPLFV